MIKRAYFRVVQELKTAALRHDIIVGNHVTTEQFYGLHNERHVVPAFSPRASSILLGNTSGSYTLPERGLSRTLENLENMLEELELRMSSEDFVSLRMICSAPITGSVALYRWMPESENKTILYVPERMHFLYTEPNVQGASTHFDMFRERGIEPVPIPLSVDTQ